MLHYNSQCKVQQYFKGGRPLPHLEKEKIPWVLLPQLSKEKIHGYWLHGEILTFDLGQLVGQLSVTLFKLVRKAPHLVQALLMGIQTHLRSDI